MDCKLAKLLLEMDRPNAPELDPEEAKELNIHFRDCPECGTMASENREVDKALGRAMSAVPVPLDLSSRVLIRLKADRNTIYRRMALRGSGILATAASLLIGLWAFFGGTNGLIPADAEVAWHEANQQTTSSPDQVEEFFQETYRVQAVAPREYDYRLLAAYDLNNFQGKKVPALLFVKNSAFARVFILSDKVFDLKNLEPVPGYNVVVSRPRDNPHFAFVTVFFKGNHEQFLAGENETTAFLSPSFLRKPD